jgi:hypothetical protein
MISGVPRYFLIRPNTEKKRTGEKEHKRIIAIGNFMGGSLEWLWDALGAVFEE